MKKLLVYFVLIICINLSTVVSADTSLSCEDFIGTWQGTVGGLTSFSLSIYDISGSCLLKFLEPGKADIAISVDGSCQQNSDGTVTMQLSHNSDSPHSSLSLHLSTPSELNVSSFSFNCWGNYYWYSASGSGTLTKCPSCVPGCIF